MDVVIKTRCRKCKRELTILDKKSDYQKCGGFCCKENVMMKFKEPDMFNCSYKIGNYDVNPYVGFDPSVINLQFGFDDTNSLQFPGIVSKNGNKKLTEAPSLDFFECLHEIAECKSIKGLSTIFVRFGEGKEEHSANYNLSTKSIDIADIDRTGNCF